jgi:hypothetical protein
VTASSDVYAGPDTYDTDRAPTDAAAAVGGGGDGRVMGRLMDHR